MDKKERLRTIAVKVMGLLDCRDMRDPLMRKAMDLLMPIIHKSLGDQGGLPERLPSFLFGMREDEFAATYLHDADLLNALAEFESALGVRAQNDGNSD